jgi:hypothetical protein
MNMSMDDLEAALQIVEENSDDAYFSGPKSDDVITLAEQALGVSFPRTYRRFLQRLGAGDIAGEEFYGITTTDFENASIPNGIWLTLKQRETSSLPKTLVVVYSPGDGSYFVLDTARTQSNGECPVVIWHPGANQDPNKLDIVAEDFGMFMLNTIRQALGA